jgi:hypothetical protein
MADTFTAYLRDITVAPNKSLMTLFNGSGSGRIIRLHRIQCLNSSPTARAGVITNFDIRTVTASSGGSAITPTAHNPSQTALAAQVVVATGATDTVADLLRRFMWSTDEATAASLSIDEIQTVPALNVVWDNGYQDTSVPSLVLREGQGVALRQAGSGTVGLVDVRFEFTNSAT